MKLVIVKNSRSFRSGTELPGRFFKPKRYNNCTGLSAAAIIKSIHPVFVYLKLKEPVNGDDDMMTMLGSIDVNTRLRVSVIDTDLIRNSFASIVHNYKHFIPPGKDRHRLGTS